MHDTSTQSASKWKTVGARTSQSSILSPTARIETRKFRPSKDKGMSNSKLFNKNKSRIESFDNIPKQDLRDQISKDGSRSKSILRSGQISGPMIRINSVPQEKFFDNTGQPLEGVVTNRSNRPVINSVFGKQKQLSLLKQDYAKFKQKVITELEIQKQNITKMVNQILLTVKQQLLNLEKKYVRNQTQKGRTEADFPSFKTFNLPNLNQNSSVGHLPDISTINHISPRQFSKNPTQKQLIAELTSSQNTQNDPITQRFSKFYSAIQKLKSDIDSLHQISVINPQTTDSPMMSPIPSPLNLNKSSQESPFKNGFSAFLKT